MADLAVTPEYLEKLAKKQDDASGKASDAATAAAKIETAVWVTHGVISGVSNSAFTAAEKVRANAGKNIATAASDLAAKLRTADTVYAGVDEDLGASIDKQVLDH
ncbi:ESX-1 secretion-associated protein [Mycobacterium sp. Lab-001]|uniref:ESX-1 secretion-associated protein n=1 Tax=Mycobacterium sp. Lab-001 TaxID=3410136 RepID=UPI003D17EA23